MKIVIDIDQATHWRATFDPSWEGREWLSAVTFNKIYEFVHDKEDDELYIVDDNGDMSTIYLVHNGELLSI